MQNNAMVAPVNPATSARPRKPNTKQAAVARNRLATRIGHESGAKPSSSVRQPGQ